MNECPQRPFTCDHCKVHNSTYKNVTEKHWPLCGFFPVTCQQKCGLTLPCQDVEMHLSSDCPLVVVDCEFKLVGCNVRLARKDMPSHLSENLVGHMALLHNQDTAAKGENMALCMNLLVGSIQRLAIDSVSLKSKLAVAEETICYQQDEITKLKENKTKQKMIIHELMCDVISNRKELCLHRQFLQPLTLISEFTMTDFQKYKTSGERWYSPPFYTSTNGYKLCIRVDANGDETARGTHLSVFSHLMKGKYDENLPWPFQNDITIQLLNQLEDRQHHVQSIYFSETRNLKVVNRVTLGERAKAGWGTRTFICHSDLGFNPDKNCLYLMYGKLKFRVFNGNTLTTGIPQTLVPQICTSPIHFTLQNFEWYRNQDREWHSPAFYTHDKGYRMCLEVYPNGCGIGWRSHVSVFICLMQGPFDENLKWPFQGRVTLKIVNQTINNNHYLMTICYNSDDSSSNDCAGRVTDKERTMGRGHEKFLPHNELQYNSRKKTHYLKSNSLQLCIIKVELQ